MLSMNNIASNNSAASNNETMEITGNNAISEKEKDKEIIIPLVENSIPKSTALAIDATDKRTYAGPPRQPFSYAAKKTVAQGMMDVALITANANQLRYLIEFQRQSPTFYVCLFLIIVSLLLQIAVGVSLIFKGRFDMKGESKFAHARKINNYVVAGVFLITIINVFIAAFNISSPVTSPPPPPPPPIIATATQPLPTNLL